MYLFGNKQQKEGTEEGKEKKLHWCGVRTLMKNNEPVDNCIGQWADIRVFAFTEYSVCMFSNKVIYRKLKP